MKISSFLIAIFFTFLTLASVGQTVEITILHTNDMHSRMLGFSPNSDYTPFSLNDDATRGGMARVKSIIDTVRARDEHVIVADAGDFLMGTVFQTLEPATGFQLRLMNTIGWDVVAIGNHEFDFGIDGLTDIITAARSLGDIPPLLLSNMQFCDSLPDDDRLESLVNQGIIMPWHIIEKGGVRIGFFSLLGKDAYEVAPYAKPMKALDQAETAVKMNAFLRNEKNADIVIALSHSGVFVDEEGNYIREDVDVAMAEPQLDLIISGHTHTKLTEPLIINGVPIVQTGAYTNNIGKSVLSFENGNTSLKSYDLIPVDDAWQGNPQIQMKIELQMERINNQVLAAMGLRADSLIVETTFPIRIDDDSLLVNSNLGPFIADAVYDYFNNADADGVDFTLVAAGLLRDNILPGATGGQYVTDLYRILPLGRGVIDKNSPGYSLARIYVTGREIKNILEIMQIAPSLSTSNYPYWSGIRYSMNNLRMPLDRVYEVEIKNDNGEWESVYLSKNAERLYSLGANAYLLEFVGMIKDLSKGVLNVVPKTKQGIPITGIEDVLLDLDPEKNGIQEAKEWAALMDFCAGFKDNNGNGIPEIPEEYNLQSMISFKDDPNDQVRGTMIHDGRHKMINMRSPVKKVTYSPVISLSASNGVTLIAWGIIIAVLVLLFFLIRFMIRRARK